MTFAIVIRVVRQLLRDRRTFGFILAAPLIVMSLMYFSLRQDETARVSLVTTGTMLLYHDQIAQQIRVEKDVKYINLKLSENLDDDAARQAIKNRLRKGLVDAVLFLPGTLLTQRAAGKAGHVELWVEGSRPMETSVAFKAISSALRHMSQTLPLLLDDSCSDQCISSINVLPVNMDEHYLYGAKNARMIDYFLPVLPPFIILFFTFILAAITFQRERLSGTLERLLVAPVPFSRILLGYIGGFVIFTALQSMIVIVFTLKLYQLPVTTNQIFSLIFVCEETMLVALAFGLCVSFVAANEFQTLQFIPLVIIPQIFLCDMIWSINTFPAWLHWIARMLPLTYANHAMRAVMIRGRPLASVWQDLLILGVFFVALIGLAALVGTRLKKNYH